MDPRHLSAIGSMSVSAEFSDCSSGSDAAATADAVVPMAAMRALDLPHDKVNIHGGACALGHPIGASAARIMVTLIGALQANDMKRGIASVCIGGGEATAVALEMMQ